jgi:hypothetical protein
MRHTAALITLAIAWAGPAAAQEPSRAYGPVSYGHLNQRDFSGSYAAGPRVYGPAGYYSYQTFAYNLGAGYTYSVSSALAAAHYAPGHQPHAHVTVRARAVHHGHP